ncbi:DMT family transporter [Epibacterium sp. Ofav1-8]|uniref:DMT family transporter n=1 Tax=Epibacterium sp. Ofav1-8 TaxID=2917735 RepID=UPI001EF6BB0B|nr:DMT family transporter [Epibacterium sp. Ofav1-8]
MPSNSVYSPTAAGIANGLVAAFAWSIYVVFAREGAVSGLISIDFALLRFGVAGLIVLPVLFSARAKPLRKVGWGRALVLTALGGPLFIGLGAGGFTYAPLAFGVSLQPAVVALSGMIIAMLFTGYRPGWIGLAGAASICLGLGLLAYGTKGFGPDLPLGAAMFIIAGLMWASFTALVAKWRIDATSATTVVSAISGAVIIPVFAAFSDLSRILDLSAFELGGQVLVQGLVAGVVAVLAFARAVASLGAAGASIFPALVPVGGILLGIPMTGATPNLQQVLATVAIGVGIALVLSQGKVTWSQRSGQSGG